LSTDPFDVATIRERVLAGWTASSARFREDANAEDDLVHGGYRDRVLIELAQNAADAATRHGVPGRLLLTLREAGDEQAVLVAANTGAPLDADGVQALATLRASAKRDAGAAVGRFGVGFAAVLAVSDEPVVLSRRGGVRFSRQDTHALVAGIASLAEELARRDGHVPALRLPFPAEGEPPEDYDTAILLPLRDGAALELTRRLLAELDDSLLLALPGLAQVVIEVDDARRELADVQARWHVLRRTGRLAPEQVRDRPTEERDRLDWSLTWALPHSAALDLPAVLHAPTPTDEPLPWPALLIASFPLEPSRRHIAPGPATDAVARAAGQAYADLVAEVVAGAAAGGQADGTSRWTAWNLVPIGLAAGALDAAVREAAVEALRHAPILAAAPSGADETLIRPRDAVALQGPAGADRAAVDALAQFVTGLVLAPPGSQAALKMLGVQQISLADLVDELSAAVPAGRSGGGNGSWRALYAAFGELGRDPSVREALATIPVPLADGRVVRGPRGAVLVEPGSPIGSALAALGVRAVDPDAAHPLLERLGATSVTARQAIERPEVRAAVSASLELAEEDEAGAEGTVDAVLTLVRAAIDAQELTADDAGWLGRLALRDVDGDIAPAAELTLPDSPAADLLDPEVVAAIDPALLRRWGGDVLRAVGVLDRFTVLRVDDVAIEEGQVDERLAGLPDIYEWVEHVWACAEDLADRAAEASTESSAAPAADVLEVTCGELVAVRDLDAVRQGAWPQVLAALAAEEALRRAVLSPARFSVRTLGGTSRLDLPSWTAWWLRRELFGGRAWSDPGAEGAVLALLGEPAEPAAGLDEAFRAALGAVRTPAGLDVGAVADVLAALADPGVDLELAALLEVWRHLAELASTVRLDDVALPARVRAVRGGKPVVVERGQAVIVDDPMWLQRSDLGAAIVLGPGQGAADLGDLLGVRRASQAAPGQVRRQGAVEAEVPAEVARLAPGAPARWFEHEELLVDGVEVFWWVQGGGPGADVHASTVDGLARALAWAAGAWSSRADLTALLDGAAGVSDLLLDRALTAVR
jgi:hypothetical protein